MEKSKEDILDFSHKELKQALTEMAEPAYRADQLFKWLYEKGLDSFSQFSNFSSGLRTALGERFIIGSLSHRKTQSSGDGTQKFLLGLADGFSIETVLIPQKSRNTACLSSQVGCKFGCPFCMSGSKGFIRNLSPSEIVGQVLAVERLSGLSVSHVVFMGIGEPLDNYENVVKAIRIINHSPGLNIGARRITLSTCGLVPGITQLKGLGMQVELSVSLHATTDDIRNKLVPVNRKFSVSTLFEALNDYSKSTGRVITLEYALIKGINDSREDAARLGKMASRLQAKVNLIPCNPNLNPLYRGPESANIKSFRDSVRHQKAKVTIRSTRGQDITAACGQLAFNPNSPKKLKDME
ncbi:MAG: 23S rRNA (adenine(2503)-C(2))-methyltransferase RlmN [Candidatus Aminicenantes bacterium]|nr:23S rRNA (adenine(2503)-C(2))-methyltransferase RlmN [Candidatus Aminicenantes bacterium]